MGKPMIQREPRPHLRGSCLPHRGKFGVGAIAFKDFQCPLNNLCRNFRATRLHHEINTVLAAMECKVPQQRAPLVSRKLCVMRMAIWAEDRGIKPTRCESCTLIVSLFIPDNFPDWFRKLWAASHHHESKRTNSVATIEPFCCEAGDRFSDQRPHFRSRPVDNLSCQQRINPDSSDYDVARMPSALCGCPRESFDGKQQRFSQVGLIENRIERFQVVERSIDRKSTRLNSSH